MMRKWMMLVLFLSANSYGANGVWTNLNGGNWSDINNWQGGTVASGVDGVADFSTLDIPVSCVVTLDTAQTIGTLLFGDTTPSHNWSLLGSNLTLSVTSGDPLVFVTNGTLTIYCAIAGTKGLKKTGEGTLTLTGTNTYTGTNTIQAGILSVGTNENLGADVSRASRSDIVFNGGTLSVTGSFTDTYRTWTFNSGGGTTIIPSGITLKKNHPNQTFYSFFDGTGTWTIKGGGTLELFKYPTGGCNYSGDIYVQDTNTTIYNNTRFLSGMLGSLGTIYMANGTRYWEATQRIGFQNKYIVLTGDVYYEARNNSAYNFFGRNINQTITMTPGSTLHLQTDDTKSYTPDVYFAQIVLQSNATIETRQGTFAQSYDAYVGISDGGNGYSFTKTGAGTLYLETANQTYGGATYLIDGTIIPLTVNGLPTGTTLIFDGITNPATFNINGRSQQIAGIGETAAHSSHIVTNSSAITNATFTINNSSNNTFGGNISGNISLTKSGTGALTLSALNTYTGMTTISSGKLLVNGILDTATNAITVNSAGTLGGTGTIRRLVTVANGGTLRPGTSIGKLTITNNISFGAGSVFAWEAKRYVDESDIGTVGTDYSQLAMSSGGNFTLASGTLGELHFPTGEDFSGSFWSSVRTWDIITGGSSSSSGSIADGDIKVYVNNALYDGGDREITGQGAFSIAYVSDGILRLTWTMIRSIPQDMNALRVRNQLRVSQ